MGEILIGTAGWSYDDWQDVVYPSEAGGKFDRLAYMAHLCDTIEINSSFYHIPSRRVVQSWLGVFPICRNFNSAPSSTRKLPINATLGRLTIF